MTTSFYGQWWHGAMVSYMGQWRLSVTQRLFSCTLGLAFTNRGVELSLLFWTVDLGRTYDLSAL